MNQVEKREFKLDIILKNIKKNLDIINNKYISIEQNGIKKNQDFIYNIKILKNYIKNNFKNEKKLLNNIKKQHLYLKNNKMNKLNHIVKEYNDILSDTKNIYENIKKISNDYIMKENCNIKIEKNNDSYKHDDSHSIYIDNLLKKLKENVNKLN
jgi:hypothetical protein